MESTINRTTLPAQGPNSNRVGRSFHINHSGCAACGAGQDVTRATVQERRIGFVFQSYALFNHMTVVDNIAFGIRIRKLPIDSKARSGLPPGNVGHPQNPIIFIPHDDCASLITNACRLGYL